LGKRGEPETSPGETLTDTAGQPEQMPDVCAAYLFVALECDRPTSGVARHSLANLDRVVVGRGPTRSSERVFDGETRVLSIRVPDGHMSARHACVERRGDGFVAFDLGSRNGTRINGVNVKEATVLADGDLVEAGHTLFRYRASILAAVSEPADMQSGPEGEDDVLTTTDPSLARRAAVLARIARSPTPLLLLGETGTGKEVLAQKIHRLSGRRGPFVAVNCGAIPAALIEAQLFGHVRGAFSGATRDAPGLLRSAHEGTLLLDEVGELAATTQVALLRAIQESEVVPVGSSEPVKVDLRIVAATHRPIEELVSIGEFRTDLYARLAGFTFCLPPLRERAEDIGLLIGAMLAEQPIRLTAAAGRALLTAAWPMNVRELFQALRVARALADDVIDTSHLPPLVVRRPRARPSMPAGDAHLVDQLVAALARHNGNVTAAARELGKARMQVQRWMKRFGVDARSFRS
jgi:transcriptional regulator with PAS, ATPase and Fis domain